MPRAPRPRRGHRSYAGPPDTRDPQTRQQAQAAARQRADDAYEARLAAMRARGARSQAARDELAAQLPTGWRVTQFWEYANPSGPAGYELDLVPFPFRGKDLAFGHWIIGEGSSQAIACTGESDEDLYLAIAAACAAMRRGRVQRGPPRLSEIRRHLTEQGVRHSRLTPRP